MLNQAWKDYQAWAKLARDMQAATGQWNLAALLCVVAAALCSPPPLCFLLVPTGRAQWPPRSPALLRSRRRSARISGARFSAPAMRPAGFRRGQPPRAIKSECFRYAARAGAYAGADDVAAAEALEGRTREIAQQARDKGLVPADGPFETSERNPIPPASMDKAWYKTNRIGDDHGGQIKYYLDARKKNRTMASYLWWLAFVSGFLAVAFGALGATVAQHFAPWIGSVTTIAAAVAAFGLLDRRKHLVASYAATQSSLERILAMDDLKPGESSRSRHDDGGSARQRAQGLAAADARHAAPAAGRDRARETGRLMSAPLSPAAFENARKRAIDHFPSGCRRKTSRPGSLDTRVAPP